MKPNFLIRKTNAYFDNYKTHFKKFKIHDYEKCFAISFNCSCNAFCCL